MKSPFDKIEFIVLAAGLGTRMKSDKAKVLHELNGKAMILYIIETLKNIVETNIIVVVGYQAEQVKKVINELHEVSFAYQKNQLGTGHAVSTAMPYIRQETENIVILCGDVPLIRDETLKKLIMEHSNGKCDMTILATKISDPTGYGRIIVNEKNVVTKIVEETDADETEKKINTINTGIYCVRKEFLSNALKIVKPSNVQGEFYFTDVINIGYKEQKKIQAVILGEDPNEYIGINSKNELEKAEKIVFERINKRP